MLRTLRRFVTRSVPTNKAKVAQEGADDVADGATRVVRRGTRPIAAAIGGGAVAGSGAYAYGSMQDTRQQRERTQRYNEYQQRINEIEKQYQRGEISKEEMERRKQEAYDAYRASQGDENAGMTFTEFLAELGTLQMLALAALTGLAIYVTVPRLFRALDGAPSAEELLG